MVIRRFEGGVGGNVLKRSWKLRFEKNILAVKIRKRPWEKGLKDLDSKIRKI